eukprot:scaffold297622_cov56-Attheya_sp.AAC.6
MKSAILLSLFLAQACAFAPPFAIKNRISYQSPIVLSSEADSTTALLPFDAYELGQESLEYKDTAFGSGEGAKEGDVVTVSFVGKLYPSGKQFSKNEEFIFEMGKGKAMPGFETGLAGSNVGTKRTLRVPPSLAFGASGAKGIPRNSDLEMECEIKAIARSPAEKILANVGVDRAAILVVCVGLLALSPLLPS